MIHALAGVFLHLRVREVLEVCDEQAVVAALREDDGRAILDEVDLTLRLVMLVGRSVLKDVDDAVDGARML